MISHFNSLKALFTNFLTPKLTLELCNPLDCWLDWLILTNHQANHKYCGLTLELKSWWIRPFVFGLSIVRHVIQCCDNKRWCLFSWTFFFYIASISTMSWASCSLYFPAAFISPNKAFKFVQSKRSYFLPSH